MVVFVEDDQQICYTLYGLTDGEATEIFLEFVWKSFW